MKFEWNESKSKSNVTKHGVSFDEAKTVFYDGDALLIGDPGHSSNEDRFILLGLSEKLRELVVSHCERIQGDNDIETIRIISARKADRFEKKQYWERKAL